MKHHSTNLQNHNQFRFLKSAFWLGLTAFGGPQLHLPYFKRELVDKHKFLSHQELIEINVFCNALPGPSTTQTISTIALKIGGRTLAALTLIAWALPGAIFMSLLALLPQIADPHVLRFLPPIVVGFMLYGVYTMFKWLDSHFLIIALFLISGILGFLFHSPWLFPSAVFLAALISGFANFKSINRPQKHNQSIPPTDNSHTANIDSSEPLLHPQKRKITSKIKSRIHRSSLKKLRKLSVYLVLFFLIGGLGIALTEYTHSSQNPAIAKYSFASQLFENTYRISALSFGGGNILAAMFLEEYVHLTQRIDMAQFHTGMAMIQAAPGPNFNLAVFINTISMKNQQVTLGFQILGSIIGIIAVFLPGLLLVYFAYPIWSRFKETSFIQKSTAGIFAVSVGFILSATLSISKDWILAMRLVSTDHILTQTSICLISILMLISGKIPTPLVVLFGLIVGWLLPL